MDISEVQVATFEEFHTVVRENHHEWAKWFYRGQPRTSDRLVPSVGREPWLSNVKDDRAMFDAWRRHSVAFVDRPDLTEWDLLAIAQHHGLKTRLLDWTFNALTAAYFAVGFDLQHVDCDAAVYAHYSPRPIIERDAIQSPFDVIGVERVRPVP